MENSYHGDKKLRAEIHNTFSSRIPFDRLEFENLPDVSKITEEEALTFSYLKTSWDVGKAVEEMTREQYLRRRRENIDVHEATHLQDDQDESFQTALPRQPVSTMEEYLKHLMNDATHSEINGLLSEMRYGRYKDFALFNALFVPALDTGARIHHPAARWIIDQMVTEIQRNPREYGFILRTTDASIRRKEIMGTLYRLPSRTHIMETLMDKIKRIHSDRLTKDDFGSLFLRSHDFDRSLLSTEEKFGLLAAGTLLAGGIGYGVKKFLERRGKALQAEEERKKMRQTQKKKKRRR
ncbi:MAG: hypothetical protein G01um101466_634 [Parcubacteria group bacterium Gr01-1014_66]|nr:MAG: hypothetical protein G01um101466_634 [Parcubacteria group bacterium Gr01-1014_66]